jgi:hypothetical protein
MKAISNFAYAVLALATIGMGFAAAQQSGIIPNSTNAGAYGPPISTVNGHISFGNAPPPTLNAACGTAPTTPVVGTDSAFKFRSGTSSNSGCAITFANAWNQSPICTITAESGAVPAYTVTASSIPLTGVADSIAYQIQCFGRPGG